MAILGSYGKISPESGVPKMYDKEEEREKDRIRGGRGYKERVKAKRRIEESGLDR